MVVDVARENPTDGTRMVAARASHELAGTVNRKRVQRPDARAPPASAQAHEGRRKRPGFFQVTRPDELWHLDMTSVWVAEHGWCYLHAAIDCCTREITGWALDVRCRAQGAIAIIDAAVADRAVGPGTLTLGSDNRTAFTSRAFRARLSELGITHRRWRLGREGARSGNASRHGGREGAAFHPLRTMPSGLWVELACRCAVWARLRDEEPAT